MWIFSVFGSIIVPQDTEVIHMGSPQYVMINAPSRARAIQARVIISISQFNLPDDPYLLVSEDNKESGR